jgi:hypothetical protein
MPRNFRDAEVKRDQMVTCCCEYVLEPSCPLKGGQLFGQLSDCQENKTVLSKIGENVISDIFLRLRQCLLRSAFRAFSHLKLTW